MIKFASYLVSSPCDFKFDSDCHWKDQIQDQIGLCLKCLELLKLIRLCLIFMHQTIENSRKHKVLQCTWIQYGFHMCNNSDCRLIKLLQYCLDLHCISKTKLKLLSYKMKPIMSPPCIHFIKNSKSGWQSLICIFTLLKPRVCFIA